MDAPEGLRTFTKYHHRMLAIMTGACLGVTVILFALLRNDFAWCGGFAVGAAAQLFKFGVLDIAAIRRIAASSQGAAGIQMLTTLLSLAVFGLAGLCIWKADWNIWAMAAGIFVPRLILLADAYLRPELFARPAGDTDRQAPEHFSKK
ncbi:MAG: hypothetical protein FWG74_05965 [Planctomycetes bacterium]|nr:hypothetical protein [Planctomycetota bacterium]